MRRFPAILCLALLLATPASAKERKCPLDLGTCLAEFGKMRNRPWYGLWSDPDSTGERHIREVVAGGPAEGIGVQPGDVIERIDGFDEAQQRAGRAGWRTLPPGEIHVRRNGREMSFQITPRRVPDAILERMIGKHMVEAHLAYEHDAEPEPKR